MQSGRQANLDSLKEELIRYYTFGPFKPNVEIKDDLIKIEIDTSTITRQKSDFDAAVKHCDAGNFNKAKPILEKLINSNPTISEYHRILGQVCSIQGKQDEAISHLINALRWDPKNTHALTMMGNIHAREKNDIAAAMTYYEHALEAKPDDNIAMNNIGANLMQLGRVAEAERYFEKAFTVNNGYPNTLYALGMIKDIKGDQLVAFDYAIQALKKSSPLNLLHSNAFELAQRASLKYIEKADSEDLFNQYSHKLAVESGKVIEVLEDDSIPTPAKLEMAENYNREKHVIRYKKDRPAINHLVMHELEHLDLIVQGRKKGTNYLFVATRDASLQSLRRQLWLQLNQKLLIFQPFHQPCLSVGCR